MAGSNNSSNRQVAAAILPLRFFYMVCDPNFPYSNPETARQHHRPVVSFFPFSPLLCKTKSDADLRDLRDLRQFIACLWYSAHVIDPCT